MHCDPEKKIKLAYCANDIMLIALYWPTLYGLPMMSQYYFSVLSWPFYFTVRRSTYSNCYLITLIILYMIFEIIQDKNLEYIYKISRDINFSLILDGMKTQ